MNKIIIKKIITTLQQVVSALSSLLWVVENEYKRIKYMGNI